MSATTSCTMLVEGVSPSVGQFMSMNVYLCLKLLEELEFNECLMFLDNVYNNVVLYCAFHYSVSEACNTQSGWYILWKRGFFFTIILTSFSLHPSR